MFTGLIEEIGIIENVKSSSQGCILTIKCKKILENLSIGDSVCVNGVCQSVVSKTSDSIVTELSNETLKITNFNSVKNQAKVNLERAMRLSDRLNGHLVNGHADCIANFIASKDDGFSKLLTFKIDNNFAKYLLYKASITINGISLTIANVKDETFSVAIIPQTLNSTNLIDLKFNDVVNIEIDILAKYVEKILLLNNNSTTTIDNNFLEVNGFI